MLGGVSLVRETSHTASGLQPGVMTCQVFVGKMILFVTSPFFQWNISQV